MPETSTTAEKVSFINLTPHTVVFQYSDGSRTEFPSEGHARVATKKGESTALEFNGKEMPVNTPTKYGAVEGLPEPQDGVIYVVSSIVITQPSVAGRKDVVAPATGPTDGAIRVDGQIVAVTRWVAA